MGATDSTTIQVQRLLGQVKWFNNKAGYGFITVSDGEQAGKDIFIHFSAITASESQYKYLVQGEYVEFVLDKSTSDAHEFHATQVAGVKGGKLMCETRRLASLNADGTDRPSYRRYRVQRDETLVDAVPSSSSSLPMSVEGEFTKVERKPRGTTGRGSGRGSSGRGSGRGSGPRKEKVSPESA